MHGRHDTRRFRRARRTAHPPERLPLDLPAGRSEFRLPQPGLLAHWRLPLGGKTLSVLSRVADSGVDYSRRSNRFAHHLVLDRPELIEAGPAWLLRQPEVMQGNWSGEPQMLLSNRPLPTGSNPSRSCAAWAAAAGDAGWGGVLAESLLADPGRVAWIVFPPDVDLLALFDESLSLIPEARRWDVTFNTYFTELPAGLNCAWRGCPAGSRTASEAIRNPAGALVIDLTRPAPLVIQTLGASAGRIGTVLPDMGRVSPETAMEPTPASAGRRASDRGGCPSRRSGYWTGCRREIRLRSLMRKRSEAIHPRSGNQRNGCRRSRRRWWNTRGRCGGGRLIESSGCSGRWCCSSVLAESSGC